MNDWIENEIDQFGYSHSARRDVTCPKCEGEASETTCEDVGGHWLICDTCGVIDLN